MPTATINRGVNTAPTVATAIAYEQSPYSLTVGATDPGQDTITAFRINWGDGSVEDFSGLPGAQARTHIYTTLGAQTISVTFLTDEDGVHSQTPTKIITVLPTTLVRIDFEQPSGDGHRRRDGQRHEQRDRAADV